jgi:hypothetical protein
LLGEKSDMVIRMEVVIKGKIRGENEVVRLGNEVVVFAFVQGRPYDRFQKITHILILHNFSFTRIKIVTHMIS